MERSKVLPESTSKNPTRIRHFFTFKRTYRKLITINLSRAKRQQINPTKPPPSLPDQRQIDVKLGKMSMDVSP